MENNNTAPSIHSSDAFECYKQFWTNYANFSGRARRSEFWWPMLFNFVLGCIPFVGWLVMLAALVPNLAVASRRLHDTGRAFGWYFILFIPLVGAILYIIWTATDSEQGENRFGANPKYNA
ncbi:DUF805 domain-containing protein [uncultured Rikenella sp.]|uniref:DUF805 domain-containing protein n=1 Tax=uncultured Rikenella sp. TaxID=368003 RepID=UPI00260E1808|nr:DUF805 domain-containing protein [uncultured Rikenella sp.]